MLQKIELSSLFHGTWADSVTEVIKCIRLMVISLQIIIFKMECVSMGFGLVFGDHTNRQSDD